MVKVKEDLTGKKFGRLTVIKQTEDYISPKGKREARWLCECECGNKNKIVARTSDLKSKNTKSCGCLHKEFMNNNNPAIRLYNTYDLSGEYGIGYTTNGEEFYFDLEDYDKIKDYTWYIDNDGYVKACELKQHKNVLLHRLILSYPNCLIDHISHKKFDNRKTNLRKTTNSQNSMNHIINSNNTSGVAGVNWDKYLKKWRARIAVDYKRIDLGVYINFEDAVKARKEAEEKYFGEYSYDNSIKKEVAL